MSNQSTQPTPHRWAEVIKAWADGRTIQVRNIPENRPAWTDDVNEEGYEPFFGSKTAEWRIKPETKTGWIAISPVGNTMLADTSAAAIQGLKRDCNARAIACIQITYTEGEGL